MLEESFVRDGHGVRRKRNREKNQPMAEVGWRGQHVDRVNTRSGGASEVRNSKEPTRPRLRSLKLSSFVYLRRQVTQFRSTVSLTMIHGMLDEPILRA